MLSFAGNIHQFGNAAYPLHRSVYKKLNAQSVT